MTKTSAELDAEIKGALADAPAGRKLTMAEHFKIAAPNGYPNWDPEAFPYRVSYWYHGSHTANMTEVAMFATEAEAQEAWRASMPGRAFRATIDVAVNPESWRQRGRWKRIATRAPRRAKAKQ